MSKYEVYVKEITGNTKIIQISNNNMITVYDLKKLINGDEPYMIRLLRNGEELDDEQFLSVECNTYHYLMKLNREIGKLVNLELLTLSNNQLTGEIPKEIRQLKNLEYFPYDRDKLTRE